MTSLDLTGLKAHHPLGFLAACGLLRCLTGSKNVRGAKLGWRIEDDKETFAVVHSDLPRSSSRGARTALDIGVIARMLLRDAERYRTCTAWTWSSKIDDRTRFRERSRAVVQGLFDSGTTRDDADMLAALASDLISRRAKGEELVQGTAFDCTSANQRLLKSFMEIADWRTRGRATEAPGRAMVRGVRSFELQLEDVLKGPWEYQDDAHSLGWDPQTQRLHSLRWKAPEKDKRGRSVRVAVFLGSLALPLFPCFAVANTLRTTGFHRDDEGNWFAWPIWREPISLDTLRSLLCHPFNGDLKQRGVHVVYRCRVAHTGGSQGNYQVFSHPEERRVPRSIR